MSASRLGGALLKRGLLPVDDTGSRRELELFVLSFSLVFLENRLSLLSLSELSSEAAAARRPCRLGMFLRTDRGDVVEKEAEPAGVGMTPRAVRASAEHIKFWFISEKRLPVVAAAAGSYRRVAMSDPIA